MPTSHLLRAVVANQQALQSLQSLAEATWATRSAVNEAVANLRATDPEQFARLSRKACGYGIDLGKATRHEVVFDREHPST